jgi:type III secretory pathway component EscT
MTVTVDELNEFRGTRPAQAISAAIFLGLGLYYLFFESGAFALVIGVLFPILGLLAVYKLLVEESIVQSISS